MNILVTTDRNYLQHAYVMLVSLLENNRNDHIDLYYIHYDLDDKSLGEFIAFFSKRNMTTIFLRADKEEFRKLYTSAHITPAVYLRIRCADLLPRKVKRILYLDPDIIVKKPLADLYRTDFGECYVAAADNYDLKIHRNPVLSIPEEYNYFNSGVMLIDVEKFRRERISEKVLDFAKKMGTKLELWDQDAFNAILYDKWICLHPRWNVHTDVIQISRENSRLNTREIREALADPSIIHFTGTPKPWEYLCTSPFCNEYRRYLRRTPYRGFKPLGFSYPNMIRKSLSKVMIYCIPKTIKNSVPSTLKKKVKDLIQGSNKSPTVVVSE